MESTPLLYQTLVQVLSCHKNWLDIRHLKTLAWMINGLILSGKISLGDWTVYVKGRAQYAQSIIRRFRRFLDNDRIEVHALYAPLVSQALQGWNRKTVYIALNTSMLWNTYCLVRLSLVYRGRAIPTVWTVLKHGSATISHDTYKALLGQAAQVLSPFNCKVIFLADRGFADTKLMQHLVELDWYIRIRIKEKFYIYRPGKRARQVKNIRLGVGRTQFWHHIQITQERFGNVHLAIGRTLRAKNVGASSAMNRPVWRPSRNMVYVLILKRTSSTINPTAFNWNLPGFGLHRHSNDFALSWLCEVFRNCGHTKKHCIL